MAHPLISVSIVTTSYDKNAAIVVLPSVSGGRLRNKILRAWLVKADLHWQTAPVELLSRILDELRLPYPEQGLAALRMWGQTGERPAKWIAAADAIYLEARMDHLCVHALRQNAVLPREMRALFDHLQSTLARDRPFSFACIASCGYLSATSPVATADVPAYVVNEQKPNDFLPSGEGSATHRNMISEIEMALHEHDVNVRRIGRGEAPINSLWLWGGGVAPEPIARTQPPLFCDDALLKGYWQSAAAVAEPWPDNIKHCLSASVAGFVAATPEFDCNSELLERCLHELREALRSKRLSRVTLLFRDGLRATVTRQHAYRFWRRDSSVLDAAA
jgi:hypothetical protein